MAWFRGGEFEGSFEAFANAQVSVFGSDFEIDGAPVPGLVPGVPTTIFSRGGVTLSATLLDGTPFEIDLNTLANPGDDFVDFGAMLNVTLVALAGDYNDDGTVNAADYVVWRNNLGAPSGTLPNDVDGGVIGAAQYETWKSNFGLAAENGALASTTVPEPASLLTIGLAVAGAFARRRRRVA